MRFFTDAVYAQVFVKSVWFALATTLLCLVLAYPLAALIAQQPAEVPRPAAAARHPAVLEQLPDPRLRVDDHPRPAGGARARRQRRARAVRRTSRCRCCSARSPCWCASSTCTCRSWCCRCTPISKSTTRRCSTRRRTSAPTRWQRFWRITFPLSLPGVYAGAALVFIPALGIFAIPDILGGPDDSLIGNVIKQQFLETRDWPFGSVLSIVLTVAALALAGLAAWVGRRGSAGGGASACVSARRWLDRGGARRLRVPVRAARHRRRLLVQRFAAQRRVGGLHARLVPQAVRTTRRCCTAAGNSLLIGLVASAVSTVLGTMAGVAMHRYRLRLLPVLVLTPIAIPEILMGVSLLIFFVLLNFTLGLRVGGARAHRVLHRLRRDRRARAPGRHGREPDRGGARLRRHAVAGVPLRDAAADHAGRHRRRADGVHAVDRRFRDHVLHRRRGHRRRCRCRSTR